MQLLQDVSACFCSLSAITGVIHYVLFAERVLSVSFLPNLIASTYKSQERPIVTLKYCNLNSLVSRLLTKCLLVIAICLKRQNIYLHRYLDLDSYLRQISMKGG